MNHPNYYERRASNTMFCLGLAFFIAGIIMFAVAVNGRIETRLWVDETEAKVADLKEKALAMKNECARLNIEENMLQGGYIQKANDVRWGVYPDPGNDFSDNDFNVTGSTVPYAN